MKKIVFKSPGFSAQKVRRSVLRILGRNKLWSMATGRASQSHINTAYFCYGDAFDFYFVSDSTARHIQNIRRSPGCAVAVFDSRQPWNADHSGLQLFGTCRQAIADETAIGLALYSKRFPAYAKYLNTQSAKAIQESTYRFYVFRPRRLKLLDESRFGEEVFVSASVLRLK